MDCMTNRETELAILGTAITDSVCAASLAAAPGELFAHADTAALHRAVTRLSKRGNVDSIALADEVKVDLVDPYALIAECMTKGFVPSMYGEYEAILGQCLKRRKLAKMAELMLADANNPAADPDALTAQVVQTLQNADVSGDKTVSLADALMDFYDGLDTAMKDAVFTGLPDLDDILLGYMPGEMGIIAARPSVGKTAFGLFVAMNIARKKGPVLFTTLEMKPKRIAARTAAAASGINGRKLRLGNLDELDRRALLNAMSDLSSVPLRISDTAYTPMQLRREAVQMKNRYGLRAIVVDYLGLMNSDTATTSIYASVTSISKELKRIAMALNVPIIVLCQLNRASEGGKDGKLFKRPPQMSEARDSGSVEQDADSFLILYDPPAPEKDSPGDPAWECYCACERNGWSQLAVIVEKNRDGQKSVAHIGFDKSHMTFHSFDFRRNT